MQKNKFILFFTIIFLSTLSVRSMEQPELPSELIAHILITSQDSLPLAIKVSIAFSQCSHESRDIVHSEHFTSQVASTYNAEKSLIALLLGNYGLPEYQEKKKLLDTYKEAKDTTELINNDNCLFETDEEHWFFKNNEVRLILTMYTNQPNYLYLKSNMYLYLYLVS